MCAASRCDALRGEEKRSYVALQFIFSLSVAVSLLPNSCRVCGRETTAKSKAVKSLKNASCSRARSGRGVLNEEEEEEEIEGVRVDMDRGRSE